MKKILATLALLLVPATAFAQNTAQFDKLIERILKLGSQAITFLMIVATVLFILAVLRLIMNKEAKDLPDKKQQVKWSIIGLGLMVAVWGLIEFAITTLGINKNPIVNIPCPPGTSQVLEGARYVCK